MRDALFIPPFYKGGIMDIPQILIFIIVNLGIALLPAGFLVWRDTYHALMGIFCMVYGGIMLIIALSGWWFLIT